MSKSWNRRQWQQWRLRKQPEMRVVQNGGGQEENVRGQPLRQGAAEGVEPQRRHGEGGQHKVQSANCRRNTWKHC